MYLAHLIRSPKVLTVPLLSQSLSSKFKVKDKTKYYFQAIIKYKESYIFPKAFTCLVCLCKRKRKENSEGSLNQRSIGGKMTNLWLNFLYGSKGHRVMLCL